MSDKSERMDIDDESKESDNEPDIELSFFRRPHQKSKTTELDNNNSDRSKAERRLKALNEKVKMLREKYKLPGIISERRNVFNSYVPPADEEKSEADSDNETKGMTR